MSFHHTKTSHIKRIFGIGLARIAAFVLVCSMVFLPTMPIFAAEEDEETDLIEQSAPEIEKEQALTSDAGESAKTDATEVGERAEDTEDEQITDAGKESVDEVHTVPVEETEIERATATSNEIEGHNATSSSDNAVVTEPLSEEETVSTTTANGTTTQMYPNEETDPASTSPIHTGTTTGHSGTASSSPNGATSTTPDNSGQNDEPAATTTVEESTENEEAEEMLGEEENIVEEEINIEPEAASSTDVVPSPQHYEATTVTNDQNRFQFAKSECISVGDGTYYCTKDADVERSTEAGVYAQTDEEGDREIFLSDGTKTTQLTDNLVDDDAPYYDQFSETIVWHRLIDGRYQIVEYDLESGEERQLTTERYNNMQPSRFGEVIVWQGWIGDDWEILIEENGDFRMLTDNNFHDISPKVNDSHVIWQAFEAGAWRVKVYDLSTGVTRTIEDAEGGSVENPRFVLVYDTKFENGDIETKGYDIESGEVIPLGVTPTKLPEKLPDPEPTDEERALVQTVTQSKPKTEQEDDTDLDDDPLLPSEATDEETHTDDADIVIPPTAESDEAEDATSTPSEGLDDIVIPSTEEGTTTPPKTVTHIPDVVIQPFVPEEGTTTVELSDSQEGVATST